MSKSDFIASMIKFIDYRLESYASREKEQAESGLIKRWLCPADQAFKVRDDEPPPPDQ